MPAPAGYSADERLRDARAIWNDAEARVAADTAEVRAAGVRALPTVFIGDTRLVGAGASEDDLVALLAR